MSVCVTLSVMGKSKSQFDYNRRPTTTSDDLFGYQLILLESVMSGLDSFYNFVKFDFEILANQNRSVQ